MDLVGTMHADYLAGLSIADVAKKYGKHRQNVHDAFRRRGLPRRDRLEAISSRAESIRAARARKAPDRIPETEREAFERRVERCGPDDCWPWRGVIYSSGYGIFNFNGTRRGAHRVALEMAGTFIPEGMFACHHCDNPPCVNPSHLYVGTPADNSRDSWARGRQKPIRGEDATNSRLTSDQVISIREAVRQNTVTPRMVLFRRLGIEHGVALTTIQNVANRVTWKHV